MSKIVFELHPADPTYTSQFAIEALSSCPNYQEIPKRYISHVELIFKEKDIIIKGDSLVGPFPLNEKTYKNSKMEKVKIYLDIEKMEQDISRRTRRLIRRASRPTS